MALVSDKCANCGYRRVLNYKEDDALVDISRFVWCLKKRLPVSSHSCCYDYRLYVDNKSF